MRGTKGRQQQQLELGGAPDAEPRAYAVSQLVRLAARKLDSAFGELWVEGEVSNLKSPMSGHVYFTLKDARAQLAVVMFRSAVARLKFRLEDGQKLRCRGRLSIYEVQGRFQLTAEAAEPAGLGALQLAFEQLKRKLSDEGLFAAEHKRPLPRLPRTVAVVTSRTGAAFRDILRVLDDRFPVRVVLCPTMVQGADAAPQIVEAIDRADQLGADVMIVGRGGGSVEDLWAFNNEGVARAIFSARTPIIAAVGHEVDLTIADLVADQRAATPSAAAELAVPVMADLTEQLDGLRQRLARAISQGLQGRALALERVRRLLASPRPLIDRRRMTLDDGQARLESALRQRLRARRDTLAQLRLRLGAHQPQARLARDRAALSARQEQLTTLLRRRLAAERARLANLAASLDALSPLAVLARGYSLAFDGEGRLVREATAVSGGDRIDLRLARGELGCTVNEVRPDAGAKAP